MLLISAVIDCMHRYFVHDSDTQGKEGWEALVYSIGMRLILYTLSDVANL